MHGDKASPWTKGFSAGRTAELVLAERGLDAPAALKLAIPVMTRVHDLMQENASAPV